MSLTRKEWEEMWKHVKDIEKEVRFISPEGTVTTSKYILSKTEKIKKQIQQVIGQME